MNIEAFENACYEHYGERNGIEKRHIKAAVKFHLRNNFATFCGDMLDRQAVKKILKEVYLYPL